MNFTCPVCGLSLATKDIGGITCAGAEAWGTAHGATPMQAELTELTARSPLPAASTPHLLRGAGTTDPGPGLRAPFPPTDQDGPGRVATPRVPGSFVPQVPVLEPGETYGVGWPD